MPLIYSLLSILQINNVIVHNISLMIANHGSSTFLSPVPICVNNHTFKIKNTLSLFKYSALAFQYLE